MKTITLLFLYLLTMLYWPLLNAEPGAPERILWDKTPIQITLTVGTERIVTFPSNVRLGLPEAVTSKLRSLSSQGNVYWLAHAPFAATRIQVQDIDNGQIYLVDLKASKDPTPTNPIIIQAKESTTAQAQTGKSTSPPQNTSLDYVQLTRFAAQQLYAPSRLLKTPHGIHRSPVKQQPSLYLIRGKAIEATPIAAWRKGRFYVTAIQLKNQGDYPIELDPRWVRGQWLAATFQHARLSAAGSETDTTALYLISDRPFTEVF